MRISAVVAFRDSSALLASTQRGYDVMFFYSHPEANLASGHRWYLQYVHVLGNS
jgi:hypothetical protein